MKLMRMAVVTSAAAISLGFSAIFSISSPVQAAQPVGEASTVKHDVVGEDFDAIARSLGISYEQAVERYSGQTEFMVALNAAEEYSPSTFAGALWLTGSSSERGIVSFVGAPTEKSLAALEELPYEVEVREDAIQSRAQLEAASERLADELHSAGVQFELSASPLLDSVSIRYEELSSPDGVIDHAHSALSLASSYFPDGVKVETQIVEKAGIAPQYLAGGEGMSDSATGEYTCTTGFTAIRGDQQGYITAGHCPNSNHNVDNSAATSSMVQEHAGTYGDGQFNSSNDSSFTPWFDTGGDFYRNVVGVAEAAVGNVVCNSGRTRDSSSCATVLEVNYCGGLVCSLVRTDGTFTNNGDSGGPWYSEFVAVGIHTGLTSSGEAVYSRINRLSAILSANVYVQ